MKNMNIVIIILLNFVVYFRTLFYDLVIDDLCRKFHKQDKVKNIFVKLFNMTKYSGYGSFSIMAEHAFTILMHTLVCISIYLTFGANKLSFFTALLFSIHPVNNQVSIWLNGKRFAVTTILILWAVHLKYGFLLYALTPLWHFCGLPAVIFFKHWWLVFIPIILFHKKIINKIGSRWERIPIGEIKSISPKKLIILVKMYGYIFLHCLLPRRMSFYHMFMERFGFSQEDNDYWYSFNKDFWKGLAIMILVIMVMILNWSNPLGQGLFWFTLFVSIWLQFPLGVTQAIAERVYYLPNVGLCYALSYALNNYFLVALFTYYLTKLWFYMPAYKDLDEFYRYALNEFPDHFRARSHAIQKELSELRSFWALKDCGVGLNFHPKDCTLNLLMCQALMTVGAWDKAEEYLLKAKEHLVPGQEKALLNFINNFQTIITERKKNPQATHQIKPNEVEVINPEDIVMEE